MPLRDCAVLIHGCHLQAEEWNSIVFRDDQGYLGRVPTGLQVAIEHEAKFIFWGSGASTCDGIKEARYTYNQTVESELEWLAQTVDKTTNKLLKYLEKVSILDEQSQNTKEEIERTLQSCKENGIKELYLISSPTHVPRCAQTGATCQKKNSNPRIYLTFSETCFANSTPEDVTVLEPPHRDDMPKTRFHRTFKRIFGLMRRPAEMTMRAFESSLNQLDERINALFDEFSNNVRTF